MVSFALTPESSGSFGELPMPSRLVRPLLAAGVALALATPAFAQDMPPPIADAMPAPAAAPQGQPGYDTAAYERARADWLGECRRRHGSGKTVGGAVAGGLVGGLLGNRVAGHGNRTEGTIIGAAVGAAAGGAIGNAADNRESRERADYCKSYLDHYASYNRGGYGYPGQGYGFAMQPMMVMVPVAMMPQAAPAKPRECVEEIVTEEYDAPPARRVIPPPRRVPPKRVPDKRVRVY
jgi:uncharacterized protein YcfJ